MTVVTTTTIVSSSSSSITIIKNHPGLVMFYKLYSRMSNKNTFKQLEYMLILMTCTILVIGRQQPVVEAKC